MGADMSQANAASASAPRPVVTFVDPLTWSREFSYEVEHSILTSAGVDLRIPADEAERDRLLPIADVVISSGTLRVDARSIESMRTCVGIQCYSVGMDAVDHVAAAARGIEIANVNASTADVADHTMALVLAAQRRIPAMLAATDARQWTLRDLTEPWEIRRLAGQVFGVVGAGRIGRQVVARAQAFGFETIAVDPFPPEPPIDGLAIVPVDELLRRSDVIVVCASLNDESRGFFDAGFFARTKPGVLFVNTARGGLVDEEALADALDSGQVGLAALDVRAQEPPLAAGDRLTGHPRVLQTPHMAAMSTQSRIDIHPLVAESVLGLLRRAGRLPAEESVS